jgi:glycosyltransferase involved in cell wall biosynthesis
VRLSIKVIRIKGNPCDGIDVCSSEKGQDLKLSLVVSTIDRFFYVERLFQSLVAQQYKNFEILFVHNEQCAAEVQELIKIFNGKLHIKTFIAQSESISAKRNVALNTAAGDIIAFPDDDCIYFPNTLQTVHEIFRVRPGVDALLATRVGLNCEWKCVPPASSTELSRVKSRYGTFKNSETFLQFYRKQCIEAVGFFDETLGPGTGLPYGSGEDTDYVLRAFSAGCAIFLSSHVTVAHPDLPFGNPELYPKAKSYAAGRMRLLQKHSMPLWFELANIAYPLCRIPLDCLPILRFRWVVFTARLKACIIGRISRKKA